MHATVENTENEYNIIIKTRLTLLFLLLLLLLPPLPRCRLHLTR